MKRLLLAAVVATAGLGTAPSASAYDCPGNIKPVGVTAGGTEAGICAGTWCPDLCLIVVDPYCGPASRQAVAIPGPCEMIDGIG